MSSIFTSDWRSIFQIIVDNVDSDLQEWAQNKRLVSEHRWRMGIAMLKSIFFVLLSAITTSSMADEFKWNWDVPLNKNRQRPQSGEKAYPDAASVWVKVATTKTYYLFVDMSTRRKLGNNMTMSHLYELQTLQQVADQQFKSVEAKAEYDCKQKKTRIISAAAYKGSMSQDLIPLIEIGDPSSIGNSANAKVVTQRRNINRAINRISNPGQWKAVIPGTSEEVLRRFACGN